MKTSDSELTGRCAVITGAAGGIGRAIARLLARRGARVFTGDFDPIEENTAEDAKLGILQRRCDVRVESDVRELIAWAIAAGGSLDILVNNAGIDLPKQIVDVTEEEWDACLDTNLKGAFFGCKHAITHMRDHGGGVIVNIASNAGLLPRAMDPVYSISKHALVALTKNLALCHGRDRIRVNTVCPGPVRRTRMMDGGLERAPDRVAFEAKLIAACPLAKAYERMIDPEEVARATLYLVNDAACMVSGTSIAIDGGKSLGVPPE